MLGLDEYGTVTNDVDGARLVLSTLLNQGTVVFSWSPNSIDGFIVMICTGFEVLGTLPFGGYPKGRIYVCMHGKSMGHFSPNDTHPSYFAEKLSMDDQSAEAWAKFWKLLWATK